MKFRDLAVSDHFSTNNHTHLIKIEPEADGLNCVGGSWQNVFSYEIPDDFEVTKLNPYKVACEWVKTHEVEVYAETLEDAIEEVNCDDGTLINTDRDGAYLDDSFEVNMEVTDALNNIMGDDDSIV